MLTARDEQRLHASHLPQSISQRRELDRLRPGATDEVDNRRSPGMMMRSHTDPRKTRYAPTGDISFSMLEHNSPNFYIGSGSVSQDKGPNMAFKLQGFALYQHCG
jgi:hypothetical protein